MAQHRAAVLGSPIKHTLSPVLHHAGYAECGLTEWAYDAHEVKAGELADFLLGLGSQWRGLSLTMPLKEEALLLASECTALALQVGGANTLLRRQDGGWAADNTDVEGVRAALASALGPRPPRTAAIIGSGATARAVLAGLNELGVTDVTLVVRAHVRESTLAQARDHGMSVRVAQFGEAAREWVDADILVNTTPPGAADVLALALAQQPAPPGQLALDCVYAEWPTAFASTCEQRGATVRSGLEMLVHQAAAQFWLMTDHAAPVEAMHRAGLAALGALTPTPD